MSPAPKITFADLVPAVADTAAVSQKLTTEFLHELVRVISENVGAGERVTIPGFGHFDRSWRKATVSRDLRTEEPVEIPGHYYPVFRPAASLRRTVNREFSERKFRPLPDEPEPTGRKIEKQPLYDEMTLRNTGTPKKSRKSTWFWLIPLLVLAVWFGIRSYSSPDEPNTGDRIEITSYVANLSEKNEDANVSPSADEEMPVTNSGGLTHLPKVQERHDILRKDNLWRISDYFYGNPYLWPNIYRGNYPGLKTPDLIRFGDVIMIPALEGEPGSLTHKDLTDISNGYLLVYYNYLKSGNPDARDYLWVASHFLPLTDSEINPDDLRIISTMKGEVRFK